MARLSHLLQERSHHFAIVEVQSVPVDDFLSFISTPRDQHGVSGSRFGQRPTNGFCPIGQQVRLGRTIVTIQNLVRDLHRVFIAGIIARDHTDVSVIFDDPTEQRTIGVVGFGRSAIDADQTTPGHATQGLQRRSQTVRCLGRIDIGREGLPQINAFHPTWNRVDRFQAPDDISQVECPGPAPQPRRTGNCRCALDQSPTCRPASSRRRPSAETSVRHGGTRAVRP